MPAKGDQKQPSITSNMKYAFKTHSGDATKKPPRLRVHQKARWNLHVIRRKHQ